MFFQGRHTQGKREKKERKKRENRPYPFDLDLPLSRKIFLISISKPKRNNLMPVIYLHDRCQFSTRSSSCLQLGKCKHHSAKFDPLLYCFDL